MRRYTSADEDSSRWDGFAFRRGDVVVSTRSKHGTTWIQAILLLLIHQSPDLPAPLPVLSPWMDHLVEPREAVHERLEHQRHRRVVKTHTPLDGIPIKNGVTYIVGARHPLDAAISLYHQGENIDRRRLQELTGAAPSPRSQRPALREWTEQWIDDAGANPAEELDSLNGVMAHLSDAWWRRAAGVVLVHYDDLLADLDGQMRQLADVLQIGVAGDRWEELVAAASLPKMRARAAQLAPNVEGVLRDSAAFFRRGTSGAAGELLPAAAIARYEARARALVDRDLFSWLHRRESG